VRAARARSLEIGTRATLAADARAWASLSESERENAVIWAVTAGLPERCDPLCAASAATVLSWGTIGRR